MMRADFSKLEKFRVTRGPLASTPRDGRNGAFIIGPLRIVVSDAANWPDDSEPWEHVSVSRADRVPTWAEMDKIKRLFFLPAETVMQLHVPTNQHINYHPFCLHLWRPTKTPIPRPPAWTVGPST